MVWAGRWEGRKGEGEGGIDNGGWVLGPMCCGVFHLGCPKYTAKPMDRIVAKWPLVPSSFGVNPSTCDVCAWCVVCLVLCVWCGRGGGKGGRVKGREASTMVGGC